MESEKNKGGRPSEYKEEYIQELVDYFNIDSNFLQPIEITGKNYYSKTDYKEIAHNLPTIQGFCRKIGISKQCFHEWKEKYKEFGDAYKEAKEQQERIWIENSLKGLYTPSFSIFLGKNIFGYKDKIETENTNINADISDELDESQRQSIAKRILNG